MIRLCLAILSFLFLPVLAKAQNDTLKLPDTTSLRISLDNTTRVLDSLENAAIKRNTEASTKYFQTLVTTNTRKEKKGAIIRLGLGLFFLAVLIVGLMRNRKRAKLRETTPLTPRGGE